ncbi:MAG: uroporphyrinogen-III C-methyltransferase, partial [Planctomycetes bacterium]|nr:uroporphyrinogen-III C-methyltransferase [Planctomycetota bacterium]
DPSLISVKGLECIRKADVLIYDYLVSADLLREAREGTEVIYVGKKGSVHTLEQDEINQLLVNKAKEGKAIVRLKGGDPFVFGRGGEEALFLKQNDVPFEIVPGITAAVAAPAYAGIPVTHRDYTATLGLVTGHEDPTKEESNIDWGKISTGIGTLTFYMGIKNLPKIVENLIKYGRSKDTPVAVIRWGTTPEQQTVVGTLEDIVKKTKDLMPPAITIVGEVVKLREQLNWFESKPLFGKIIAITRSRDQASEFAEQLQECGAKVIEFPTIKTVPPDNLEPMDKAIEKIESFDWLIFTSVNGVDAFFGRLFDLGKDIRSLKGVKICSIGPATTERIKGFYLHVDCQPSKYVAESVVEELKKAENLKGKKILMPRADIARSYLPDELQKLGAEAVEVVAYKTILATPEDASLLERLRKGNVDVVTFTSSSTVRNFVEVVGKEYISRLNGRVKFVSIGPITTRTAEELGIHVSLEAKEHTIPGLVEAIVKFVGH